jgi:hypothetical protein
MREPKSFLALLKQVEGLGITESNAYTKEQGFRPVQVSEANIVFQ